MELPTNLSGIISLLDQEVPKFSCQGHGYRVTSGKGTLGTSWELMVKSVDLSNEEIPLAPVGRIVLEKLDDDLGSTLRKSPLWRERDDLLQSVPGVGPVLSVTLLAELPELGTLYRRES